MKRCIQFLMLALAIGLTGEPYAAQPRLSKSELSSLIRQPSITAIYRDSNGYLWIGTQGGLYKFDGADMTFFNSEKNNRNWIPGSHITDIAEDTEGNLLVTTFSGGFLRWNRGTNQFESPAQTFSFNMASLTHIHVSQQGQIWISSADSVFVYEPKFEQLQESYRNDEITHIAGSPHAFLEDNSGNLFIGGSEGLAKIFLQTGSVVPLDIVAAAIPITSSVTALALSENGNIIIGTNSGHLAVLNPRTEAILATSLIKKGTLTYISDLALSDEGLTIATDRGLYLSDHNLSSIKNVSHQGAGLSINDVSTLYVDGKHIWVGTYQGLDILSFVPFELLTQRNSQISNDVSSFSEDDAGQIWIGTFDGLYTFDTTTQMHTEYGAAANSPGLIDKKITSIQFKGQHLWIGYYQSGVQVINPQDNTSFIPTLAKSNILSVTDILANKDSEDVWIATYNHGLFRVTPDKTYAYNNANQLPEKSVTLLFETHSEQLLVVAVNKIFQYDPEDDQFDHIGFDYGLGSKLPIVHTLKQSKNGDLWIGTQDHGLFRWRHEDQKSGQSSLQATGIDEYTPSTTIYGMELDSEGNQWCSTQNGIFKLDPDGTLIKRFTIADGLQGNDFNLGSSFSSRSGNIYFGGANGYNRFNPAQVHIDRSASAMRLTGIHYPGNSGMTTGEMANLSSVQLTHGDRYITFKFSVLDFIEPNENQYRYKLENFDADWIDNGSSNTITYTRLPVGNYVFRVQGANSAGIWNREGISLDVHVLPPPWLSWWAFCLYTLALMLLAWCAHRIYQSYVIDRKAAELALEMLATEDRADDDMHEQLELQEEFVQSAYRHNLATMSLISDCINLEHDDQEGVANHQLSQGSLKRISILSYLEDCIYYQPGGPAANLHKFTDLAIAKLLKNAIISPETVISINEVPSHLIPTELASPLAIIIYELLENCMQHAFELKSPANYIQISLSITSEDDSSGKQYKLSVLDNGIGIQENVPDQANKYSGSAIIVSIAEKLGGKVNFVVAKGTAVSVTFPINDTK